MVGLVVDDLDGLVVDPVDAVDEAQDLEGPDRQPELLLDGEDVALALDATAVARNRLRVDARKWVASKLKPKKYGDKMTQEHTGADGGAIQTVTTFRLADLE